MNRIRLAALSLGATLVVGALALPMGVFAAGNSYFSFTPASQTVASNPTTGIGTFSVSGVINVAADSQDGALGFSWNTSLVQLQSISEPAAPTGCSWAGSEPDAGTIATLNATAGTATLDGTYNSYFCTGSNKVAANTALTMFTATFVTKGFGNTQISVDDASSVVMGTGANAGTPQALDADQNAAVLNLAPTPTPTPAPATPTPVPTPTPNVMGTSGPVNVTGTVDFGFLSVSAPASVTINLVRNATATADCPVIVYSNIIWNLQVSDPKTTNHGYMTSGTNVLANSMHVVSSTTNVDLAGSPDPFTLASGSSSQTVATTLSQFTAPQDKQGTYGMQIVFTAIPGF